MKKTEMEQGECFSAWLRVGLDCQAEGCLAQRTPPPGELRKPRTDAPLQG